MKSIAAACLRALPALAAASLLTAAQAVPPARWTIEHLGNLGAGGTVAFGVNNRGEIVGYGRTAAGDIRAFHWQGAIANLGALNPGYPSALWAINDHGLAVGITNTYLAFWQDGAWRSTGLVAVPADINKSGDAVGTFSTGSAVHGFVFRNGVMHDIAPFAAGRELSSNAQAVNDRGVVTGGAAVAYATMHAYTWKDGVMTDLGTLGGAWSTGIDINNHGVVVGQSADAHGAVRAFMHDGAMRAVCGLPAGSDAQGINDRGAVVGTVGGYHGYLCEDGVLTILNDIPEVQAAGWRQMFPMDINERGWIVGWGFKAGGSSNGDAFVLKPR